MCEGECLYVKWNVDHETEVENWGTPTDLPFEVDGAQPLEYSCRNGRTKVTQ